MTNFAVWTWTNAVDNASQAFHLYNANAIGWGLESNSIQLVWLYSTSIWHQLYRDSEGSNSRQLSHSAYLLFGPSLFRRRASTWIQIVFTCNSAKCWRGRCRRGDLEFEWSGVKWMGWVGWYFGEVEVVRVLQEEGRGGCSRETGLVVIRFERNKALAPMCVWISLFTCW